MAKENTIDPFPGPRPLAWQVPGQAVSRQGRATSEGQVVPKDHSLVKPNEIILWQRFTYRRVKYYREKAKEGGPPSSLVTIV